MVLDWWIELPIVRPMGIRYQGVELQAQDRLRCGPFCAQCHQDIRSQKRWELARRYICPGVPSDA